MLYVDNENVTDPRHNLALEEHLLRNLDTAEPILLFYINEPSVIIGRNQNALQEIDPAYVESQGIHLVRRLSGGGAVYHDLGNLNFSFVTQGSEDLHNFEKFTEPVVSVLRALGVEAELQGKSDIFAAGKKVSGNAQYLSRGRMFSHGTLLFDTDLGEMLQALNPRGAAITSKAVQSVRNFVTNLRELLPPDMDIEDFKQALLRGIFDGGPVPTYALTEADRAAVAHIAADRYGSWEWNVGRAPEFNVQREGDTPAGNVTAHIDVAHGRIARIRFMGNFASRRDVETLATHLRGVRYEPDALTAALAGIDLQPFFGSISPAALAALLY